MTMPTTAGAHRSVSAALAARAAANPDATCLGFASIFVHGPSAGPLLSKAMPWSGLASDGSSQPPAVRDMDPAVMLFTSGSTGAPTACVLAHRCALRAGEIHAMYLRLTRDDVLLTPFPLFHVDAATPTVCAALAVGGTAALSARFSASPFWDEVRSSRATVSNFVGATANLLWKQPPSADDRNHQVRLASGVPMPACEPAWEDRFGFPLVEVSGLTDIGVPVYQPLDEPRRPGSCGRVIPEYEVGVAGPYGHPVPAGDEGEIQARSEDPGLTMTEYFGMSEETERDFRDGWFHTDDLGRVDQDGFVDFVSRSAEVTRRRGENIAATDVRAGIEQHPGVAEVAAVGVPSDLSEVDVKVFVVAQPGAHLSAESIHTHATSSLPRSMVPRHVEILDALPKTATEQVARNLLAARPTTSHVWDAESSEQPKPVPWEEENR